jgi:hypothetical protein
MATQSTPVHSLSISSDKTDVSENRMPAAPPGDTGTPEDDEYDGELHNINYIEVS